MHATRMNGTASELPLGHAADTAQAQPRRHMRTPPQQPAARTP
jgi:hypothetical protein